MTALRTNKPLTVTAKVAKTLMVATSVAILAACSPSTTTNQVSSPTTETNPPESTTTTAPATQQSSTIIAAIPNVKDVSEIKFVEPAADTLPSGSFDIVNDSTALNHVISPTTPVAVGGWAILPLKSKPADKVLITEGDSNKIIGVATVDLPRPDVSKVLQNPAAETSGWTTSIESSLLSSGTVNLKAWAYDAETKEATLLVNTHAVSVK